MHKSVRYLIAIGAVAILVVSVLGWYSSRKGLPGEIRIAAGKRDGLYHTFAQRLASFLSDRTGRRVRVIETTGTEVKSGCCVTARRTSPSSRPTPWPPMVSRGSRHCSLNRSTSSSGTREFARVADLVHRRVALGSPGSGMRQNSLTVLAHYQVPLDRLTDVGEPFGALATDSNLDAAFVTTGWMNPLLLKQLQRHEWNWSASPTRRGWPCVTRGSPPPRSPVGSTPASRRCRPSPCPRSR